jgi:hypothetical protein
MTDRSLDGRAVSYLGILIAGEWGHGDILYQKLYEPYLNEYVAYPRESSTYCLCFRCQGRAEAKLNQGGKCDEPHYWIFRLMNTSRSCSI